MVPDVVENFVLVPANYSCWYAQDGGNMEIKTTVFPELTTICDLVHTSKYILCQNVTLEVGKLYEKKSSFLEVC